MQYNLNVDVVRQSITIITKVLSGKGIKVTQSGTSAYVESSNGVPKRINIPYIPDNASSELILAINGFLDHEVAHVLFTNFTVSQNEHFASTSIFQIYNAIEDCRIEKCMREKFAGSRTNLDGVSNFFIEKYIEPQFAIASNEHDMLTALFTPAVRAWSGQVIFQNYMKGKWANISQLEDKIESAIPKIALVRSTKEAVDLAHEIGRLMNDSKSPKTDKKEKGKREEESDDERGEHIKPPKSDEKGEGSSNSENEEEGETIVKDEEDHSKDEDSSDSDSDKEMSEDEDKEDKGDENSEGDDEESKSLSEELESKESGEQDGKQAEPDSSEEGDLDEEQSESGVGMTLDLESAIESANSDISKSISEMISGTVEKSFSDADYKVFSTDYDLIDRLDISHCNINEVNRALSKIEESARQITGPLQKTLERLVKSKSLVRNLPGKRSGRINASSLFRLKTGDDRVFRQRDMGISNDVAVSLVVDCSGSMNGTKIRIAMEGAFALCDVLTRIGVTNEVIGFTTLEDDGGMYKDCDRSPEKMSIYEFSRVEALHIPIFKGFDEKFGIQQKQRMAVGSMSGRGLKLRNNVDGESIRIASKRLMTMTREKTKQMIVLSDGCPCAGGDSRAINRDLFNSIKSIEDIGINIIGIGINDDSVKRFYKNSLVIRNVNELPALIIKELRSMLV